MGAMSYRTEFPGFEDAPAADWLRAFGFEDTSWHNDACPSEPEPRHPHITQALDAFTEEAAKRGLEINQP